MKYIKWLKAFKIAINIQSTKAIHNFIAQNITAFTIIVSVIKIDTIIKLQLCYINHNTQGLSCAIRQYAFKFLKAFYNNGTFIIITRLIGPKNKSPLGMMSTPTFIINIVLWLQAA